jgi:hypothetical protein
VDATGAVRGYATFDLRALGPMESWALARGNVWRVERALLANRHRTLRLSPARERGLRERYLRWKAEHPGQGEPPRSFYSGRARFR